MDGVEPAVKEDALVLERERDLDPDAVQSFEPPGQRALPPGLHEPCDPFVVLVGGTRIPREQHAPDVLGGRRRLDQDVHGVADLECGEADPLLGGGALPVEG